MNEYYKNLFFLIPKMATPNYKLKDEHVATCGHVRGVYSTLDNTKANKTDVTTLLSEKLNISGGTMTGNLDTSNNRLIVQRNAILNHDAVNKETLDTGLVTKKNTGTFDTKI